MMEEQLISFETAKLAKEKGFKLGSGWQIRSLFNIKDGKTFCEKTIETPEHACERCSQSLLQKWLREEYKLEINIQSDGMGFHMYIVNRTKLLRAKIGENNIFQTYEEALEQGLFESLKLI